MPCVVKQQSMLSLWASGATWARGSGVEGFRSFRAEGARGLGSYGQGSGPSSVWDAGGWRCLGKHQPLKGSWKHQPPASGMCAGLRVAGTSHAGRGQLSDACYCMQVAALRAAWLSAVCLRLRAAWLSAVCLRLRAAWLSAVCLRLRAAWLSAVCLRLRAAWLCAVCLRLRAAWLCAVCLRQGGAATVIQACASVMLECVFV
jgi:hypothetical protein